MAYYTAETNARGTVTNSKMWKPTQAATLTDAKRAAANAKVFQGTTVWVGEETASGEIQPVAVKVADPINMRLHGVWEDIS